jgi:carbon monoxide dehydrogenase subunit G
LTGLDVIGVKLPLIKMEFKQEVVINLSPEDIFAYVSDLENLADWSSVVISVRKISQESMHVGATVRCTIRFLGRWFETSFELVECKPVHYLTIKSISGVAPCLIYYQLEPVESGGTSVSLEQVIHVTGRYLGLADPVASNIIRRQVEYDLLTLKDLLEAKLAI